MSAVKREAARLADQGIKRSPSHAAVKCGQRAGGSWILDGARAVAVALRGRPIRNGRSRWLRLACRPLALLLSAAVPALDLDRVPPPHRPRIILCLVGWLERSTLICSRPGGVVRCGLEKWSTVTEREVRSSDLGRQ